MTPTLASSAVAAATLTVLASGLIPASATAGHHAKPVTKHYFEKTSSFTQGQDSIEFTDLLFVGNHTKHAKKYSGTDHIECDLSTGQPICDGQFAFGNDMLLVKGKAGTGTFTIPIVGGTGALKGAKGTLRNTTLKSGNSDLVFTYRIS